MHGEKIANSLVLQTGPAIVFVEFHRMHVASRHQIERPQDGAMGKMQSRAVERIKKHRCIADRKHIANPGLRAPPGAKHGAIGSVGQVSVRP
mgnify:CR=1